MRRLSLPGYRRVALLAAALIVPAVAPWSAYRPVHAAGSTTLTVAIAAEPDTLDPQVTGAAVTGQIDAYIGDSLVALSPGNQIVPDLARSYTVSSDGLLYSFTLRQDVTFQDGTPLDAAAYVATFKRLLNPATRAGVEAGRLGQVAAVTATGKYTFTIRLAKPYVYLLYNLTDSNYIPLSPTALKVGAAGFGRKPVSTGPWQVQQWQTGSQIVLVRNPRYHWGPSFVQSRPPSIDKIIFRILPNSASSTDALQSGEVDELPLPAASVARIQSSGQYTILKSLQDGVGFLEFNVTRAPFTDIVVRQAINAAIDKQAVVQVALSGLGVPVYGVLSPVIQGYWPGIKNYGPAYNPQKALALLAKDGYVMHNGLLEKNGTPLSFTAVTFAFEPFQKTALVVQAQLKQVGITMNIQQQDLASAIATEQQGKSAADFEEYIYPLADIFYTWFHSSQIGSGFADSHYKDSKLDALIVKMRTTADTAARDALLVQLEKYVSDKALWVPLWDPYVYTALQPRVKGAFLDARGRVILNNATLK